MRLGLRQRRLRALRQCRLQPNVGSTVEGRRCSVRPDRHSKTKHRSRPVIGANISPAGPGAIASER